MIFNRTSRKAQAPQIIGVAVFVALILALTLWSVKKPDVDTDYIGQNQIRILETASRAENALLYVDVAAKIAADQSIAQLASSGGTYSLEETPACGTYYGYNLLQALIEGQKEECFPEDLKTDYSDVFSLSLASYFHAYPDTELRSYAPNYDYALTDGVLTATAKDKITFDIVKESAEEITQEVNEQSSSSLSGPVGDNLFDFAEQFVGLPYVFGGNTPPKNEPWKSCGECMLQNCHDQCLIDQSHCKECVYPGSSSSAWQNECKNVCSNVFNWYSTVKACYPNTGTKICPKGTSCSNRCGDSSFDCSGFVGYVERMVQDIHLVRISRDQYWQCDDENKDFYCEWITIRSTDDLEKLQPGDILFKGSTSSTGETSCVSTTGSGRIHHVMLYIGKENGVYRTYEAMATKMGINKGKFTTKGGICGAIRIRPKNAPLSLPSTVSREDTFILIEGDVDGKGTSYLNLISGGTVVKKYEVGIGRNGMGKTKAGDEKTPAGDYKIKWKASVYEEKDKPDDNIWRITPENSYCSGNTFVHMTNGPSGEKLWTDAYGGSEAFVMGLDYPNPDDRNKGYTGSCIEIHASKGTTSGYASAGCTRMNPSEAKVVYDAINVGTPVIIRNGAVDINEFLTQQNGPADAPHEPTVSDINSDGKVVVIDPGHGTSYNNNPRENVIVLQIGLELEKILKEKGITVYMTRTTTDTSNGLIQGTGSPTGTNGKQFADNVARAEIGNSKKADLVIRLHSNSGSAKGFFLMYPEANKQCNPNSFSACRTAPKGPPAEIAAASKEAAQTISREVAKVLPKQADPEPDGVHKGGYNLIGSSQSKVPTTLIEIYGHENNALYNEYKTSEDKRRKAAQAIADGVIAYLGETGSPASSPSSAGSTEGGNGPAINPESSGNSVEMTDGERAKVEKVNQYAELIRKYSEKYDVPSAVVSAMIAWESGGRPDAVSYTGCAGLGQFCFSTAKGYQPAIFEKLTSCRCGGSGQPKCSNVAARRCNSGNDDRFDPEKSIEATAKKLAAHWKQENQCIYLVAAAYNAGGGVSKAIREKLGNKQCTYENIKPLIRDAIASISQYSSGGEAKINSKTKEVNTHMTMVARFYEIYGGLSEAQTRTETSETGLKKTYVVKTIGKYSVNPSFSIESNTLFNEFDVIKSEIVGKGAAKGMIGLVSECEKTGKKIEECVAESVESINQRQIMKDAKLKMFNGPCNPKENLWSDFVEDFGDCVNISQNDCYCRITINKAEQSEFDDKVKVKVGSEGGIKVSLDEPDIKLEYDFNQGIHSTGTTEGSISGEVQTSTSSSSVNEFSENIKDGDIYFVSKNNREYEITDTAPKMDECSIEKRTFKFCVQSETKIPHYDRSLGIVDDKIEHKFAIQFLDPIPPEGVQNLKAEDKLKAEKSIIVEFDAPKKDGKIIPDLKQYLVYISPTDFIKGSDGQPILAGISSTTVDAGKDGALKDNVKLELTRSGGSDIADGTEYHVAVVPVDASENKGKAATATAESVDDLAPGKVKFKAEGKSFDFSGKITPSSGTVDFEWQKPKNEDGSELDDLKEYWIFLSQDAIDFSLCGAGCSAEQGTSRLMTAIPGTEYNIAVIAVDSSNNHIITDAEFTAPAQWSGVEEAEGQAPAGGLSSPPAESQNQPQTDTSDYFGEAYPDVEGRYFDIAIVLDDTGETADSNSMVSELIQAGKPGMTFAFPPGSENQVKKRIGTDYPESDIIMQQPMEYVEQPEDNIQAPKECSDGTSYTERGIICNQDSPDKAEAILKKNLALFEGTSIAGFNSYQGSLVTQNREIIKGLADAAKQNNMIFLDSNTIPTTIAYDIMKQNGARAYKRTGSFLEGCSNYAGISDAAKKKCAMDGLKELETLALQKGYAVGIGHATSLTTIAAIEEFIKDFEKEDNHYVKKIEGRKVRIVKISELPE